MQSAQDHKNYTFSNDELTKNAMPRKVSPISSCLEKVQKKWHKKNQIGALWNDWEKLVGKQLSTNCQPISLKAGLLIIGANHPQWLQALQYNRNQLLANIKSSGHKVKNIRIQQYHSKTIKRDFESEKEIWKNHPSRIDVHGQNNCKICGIPSPSGEISLWGRCSFCRRKQLI